MLETKMNILCTIYSHCQTQNIHIDTQDPNHTMIIWTHMVYNIQSKTLCLYEQNDYSFKQQRTKKKHSDARLINTMEINESILDFALFQTLVCLCLPNAIKFEFSFKVQYDHDMHKLRHTTYNVQRTVGTCLMCIFDKFVVFFFSCSLNCLFHEQRLASFQCSRTYAICDKQRPIGNR